MAAKIGGDDDAPIVDINVTPLVDIVLVLLIIFMVTASLINQPAIKVDLPEAANPDDNPSSSLGLVLTRDNELYLNGNRSSFDELRSFVPQELKRVKDLQAIIQADRACTHGQVIELIDTIKGLGVTKFALNIEQVNMGGTALPPLGGTPPNPANPPPPVAN